MTHRPSRSPFLVLAMLLLIGGGALALLGVMTACRGTGPIPRPTVTEPLLPPPPTGAAGGALPTPLAHGAAALGPVQAGSAEGLYPVWQRLGVGVSGARLDSALAGRLGLGWYLDWTAEPDRFHSSGVEYMPMIRVTGGVPSLDEGALRDAVRAYPRAVWLIGNEPDVRWQDNVTAEVYAQLYHDLYARLKALDPACRVAIGGVSQPTPLRLRYLDEVLETYLDLYGEAMPVDVWNVHNFVLPEERGSWGVDIPPGMPDQNGRVCEIDDHDDLAIFRQQIVDFRRWLKERGQQDKELIITEYGILMPADYGFPNERVERFMLATFDLLRTATDPDLGNPRDGYRLVQRWSWFSLADPRYPTGNLRKADGVQLTPLGEAFGRYAYSSR